MPATEAIWITRQNVTLRHLRGLVEGLEGKEALDFAQIKIITLPSDLSAGVSIPGEFFPDGRERVFTDANLPPEGMLILPAS